MDNSGTGGNRSRTLSGTEVYEVGQGPVLTPTSLITLCDTSAMNLKDFGFKLSVLFLKWILSCEDMADYEACRHNSNRNELSGM